MDRFKRQRAPKRTALRRTFLEIEAELQKDEPDVVLLREKRRKLQDLEDSTGELDNRISELMLDDDVPEAEYIAEAEAVEEYVDNLKRWKLRLDLLLDDQAPPPPRNPPSVASSFRTSTASGASRKRQYKLPKVELRKFSGDMKDWLSWWAQFEKIHEDEELHATDKFSYLIQALTEGSSSRKLVEGYPQTAVNYPKAIAALKERFGDTTYLTEYYVRQLSRLVIRNASKTKKLSLLVMYDELDSSLRALESLGVTLAQSAAFLYPLVESSLPEDLLKVWQRSPLSGYHNDDEDEDQRGVDDRLSALMRFLKKEVKGAQRLAIVNEGIEAEEAPQKTKNKSRNSDCPTAASLIATDSRKCIFCEKGHESRDCAKAAEMSLEERKQKVKEKRCCYACLRSGHNANKCKGFVRCVICSKKHYPLFCPDLPSTTKSASVQPVATNSMSSVATSTSTVLQTLCVRVSGARGSREVRALIDTGAQRSYLTSSLAEEIGATCIGKKELIHNVFGGGSTSRKAHNLHQVELSSLNGTKKLTMELLSQETICNAIPPIRQGPWLKKLKKQGIIITDLHCRTGEVEVLLGSDSIPQLLTGVTRRLSDHLVAMETVLGWTLMGRVDGGADNESFSGMVITTCLDANEIDKLWRLETIGITDPIQRKSQEEKELAAKVHFEKTVTQGNDGRYEVALPWVENSNELPTNYSIAFSRLKTATGKLNKLGRYSDYDQVFQDWMKEGIIERVPLEIKIGHYLPHRPVFKPQSLPTPVRPVFDASCKDKRSPSLNELLETGPNLLEVIPTLVNRFRRHTVGAIADIRKAFQMISVRKDDRDFLKFLWWDSWGNVITYRHTRVVFGVSSSPFLLAAVLGHHLSKCTPEYKGTADLLIKSLYVDNVVCSFPSLHLYQVFQEQSVQLLSQVQMELRQWEHSAVDGAGIGLNEGCGLAYGSGCSQPEMEKSTTSVLGMTWDKQTDRLSCIVPEFEFAGIVTKRIILSACAKIFDPMGLLSPATLLPKLLLQESWALKIGWDSELPEEISKKFKAWANQISSIKDIAVPRNAFGSEEQDVVEVHTFCDASAVAYAAMVFIRTARGDQVNVQLLLSKSRVAPKKTATIPRLELLGCLIGARLGSAVIKDLDLQSAEKYFWTDSTTALAWIQRNDKWGTFVGNRVKEITSLTEAWDWRHIPGEINPADVPSRGCSISDLARMTWWEGPEWLKMSSSKWPISFFKIDDEDVISAEAATTLVSSDCESTESPWYVKCSNYLTNLRVLAWIRRFVSNVRKQSSIRGDLTVEELATAELHLIKLVQKDCFPKTCDHMQGVRVIRAEDGTLRVLTKLLHKKDNEDFRKPLVLPNSHPVTTQLIRHTHFKHGHAGIQFLMSNLREKVWILGGRRAIKAVVKKCVVCKRYSTKPPDVDAAPLPSDRVETGPAFGVTGVDLAGPLFLKNNEKAWVVIFTCAVYRAVHLELIGSLSTDAFLLSLQKFVCRRGRPVTIWSDNGTNFRGSYETWKKLDWKRIQRETSTIPIKCKFIPPTAAWWGGWWERLIRSLKDQLRKMLGHGKVSRVQMESLLCDVESTMNGRPLTYVTEDSSDLIPLTPEMFLHDLRSSVLPEVQSVDAGVLRSTNVDLQKLREELRQRFRREYLSLLVHVGKAKQSTKFQVGDVVLVGADGKKRLMWPMGRIEELIVGADGKVRVATVRVKDSIVTRPLQRLFPLEVSPENFPSLPNKTTSNESPVDVTRTRSGRRVIKPKFYGVSD